MSSLTNAQRKMCVELIAHSNIKFEQRDNQYIAQVKVGPQDKTDAPSKKLKEASKKRISRTVKVGGLTWLEELHPFLEIYIYPKRMQLSALCEIVENGY